MFTPFIHKVSLRSIKIGRPLSLCYYDYPFRSFEMGISVTVGMVPLVSTVAATVPPSTYDYEHLFTNLSTPMKSKITATIGTKTMATTLPGSVPGPA
jgi:hypothetical protein